VNRRLFTILAAFSLLGAPGCRQAPRAAAQPIRSIDWSGYPRTDAFEYFRRSHESPDGWDFPEPRESPLLVVTWFLNERAALEYEVKEDGKERNCRHVYNFAIQDRQTKQLTDSQIREVEALVAELPTSTIPPPLHRLVIVSRSVGGNWRTDIYDAASLCGKWSL
jgi:hypothetical protein